MILYEHAKLKENKTLIKALLQSHLEGRQEILLRLNKCGRCMLKLF